MGEGLAGAPRVLWQRARTLRALNVYDPWGRTIDVLPAGALKWVRGRPCTRRLGPPGVLGIFVGPGPAFIVWDPDPDDQRDSGIQADAVELLPEFTDDPAAAEARREAGDA